MEDNKTTAPKVQTFINNCLRRILRIHWPKTISNEDLWQQIKQGPIDIQINKRRWGWIGHTLRKPATSITRKALSWNPQGKCKRRRPKNSWRRDLIEDIGILGFNWVEIENNSTGPETSESSCWWPMP
ncbi:uncharacterized protein LOC127861966 [Dreissena polymorpha]|uniref:uncharacterized protein LOC127861966 n=1 Tax=Dreissena polymorpha TaxID=45954 RepID=UPI0022654538|nr:uncharacterized protein LOC127861966 [Dreissena polymorpha]